MIVSYRDKRTRDFAAGRRVKAFSGIDRPARLKLDRLEAATALRDFGCRCPAMDLKPWRVIAKDSTVSASMTNGAFVSRGPTMSPGHPT